MSKGVPEHSPAKPPGLQQEGLPPKRTLQFEDVPCGGAHAVPVPRGGRLGGTSTSSPTTTFFAHGRGIRSGEDDPDMIQHRNPARPSRCDWHRASSGQNGGAGSCRFEAPGAPPAASQTPSPPSLKQSVFFQPQKERLRQGCRLTLLIAKQPRCDLSNAPSGAPLARRLGRLQACGTRHVLQRALELYDFT